MVNGFIFFIGMCIGSFLNVCIYRIPAGKSIVRPASACPNCGAVIRWYDNIPLLSYLILRGRCRGCDTRISIRYPIIEVLCGLFAMTCGLQYCY
jgi:leader peptidase (prepilin peptidase) / N-methyltransferase